jgi:hypothetical protein
MVPSTSVGRPWALGEAPSPLCRTWEIKPEVIPTPPPPQPPPPHPTVWRENEVPSVLGVGKQLKNLQRWASNHFLKPGIRNSANSLAHSAITNPHIS